MLLIASTLSLLTTHTQTHTYTHTHTHTHTITRALVFLLFVAESGSGRRTQKACIAGLAPTMSLWRRFRTYCPACMCGWWTLQALGQAVGHFPAHVFGLLCIVTVGEVAQRERPDAPYKHDEVRGAPVHVPRQGQVCSGRRMARDGVSQGGLRRGCQYCCCESSLARCLCVLSITELSRRRCKRWITTLSGLAPSRSTLITRVWLTLDLARVWHVEV